MTRKNSFDLARLFAALMVLISHHFALSGLPEPRVAGFESAGGLAVVIFFAISGYLISLSATRSDDFISFMTKRAKRILPALIVCAVVVNIFLGHMFNPGIGIIDMISNSVKTMSFNGHGIMATSPDFRISRLVNGSLWTLPLEVMCYLIVGLIMVISSRKEAYVVTMLLLLILSYIFYFNKTSANIFSVPVDLIFPRALAFFIGSVMAMYKDSWSNTKTKLFLIIFLSAYMFGASDNIINLKISGYILFSVLTIVICTTFNETLISGRFDYSYGIYIYAFPVQQLIITKTNLGFYGGMAAAAAIVIIMSGLSWHFVESRFLRKEGVRKEAKA